MINILISTQAKTSSSSWSQRHHNPGGDMPALVFAVVKRGLRPAQHIGWRCARSFVYRMGTIVTAIEVNAVEIVDAESERYIDMSRSHRRWREGEVKLTLLAARG